MDVSCAITNALDNSSEEFSFEVPITNLKLEESAADDIEYVVTADNAALKADTTCVGALSRTAFNGPRREIYEIDSAIVTDGIIFEKTSVSNNEAIISNSPIEIPIEFDGEVKDVLSRTDSGTIVIDDSEPLENVLDNNRNNIIIEIDSTTVIDDTISEKTSYLCDQAKIKNSIKKAIEKPKIGNNNLKEIEIYLDETKTNDESLIQSKADIDVKEIKYSIDIEETQIQSVAVFNGNGTDSENDLEEILQAPNAKDIEETEGLMGVDETMIQNVIVLDGNKTDSDVILLDGNKTDSASTIILDNDEIIEYTKSSKRLLNPFAQVIDIEKDSDCSIVESTIKTNKNCGHSNVYQDNPLLLELLEKCLDMENTDGMTRVINRTLLTIYKDVDEEYKNSEAFKKFLTRTIMHLDVEPRKKFSHIKNLCNELKLHKTKKRLPFITLESKEDREQSTSSIPTKRRKVDVVINLDDDTRSDVHHYQTRRSEKLRKEIQPISKEFPPIEIDSDSSENDNDVILLDNHNSNKENSGTSQDLTKKAVTNRKRKIKKGRKSNLSNPKNPKKLAIKKKNARLRINNLTGALYQNRVSTSSITSQDDKSNNIHEMFESEMLLEPRLAVEVNIAEFNQDKINYIESRIAFLKKRLEKLEEAEVTTNSRFSPYLECEMLKTSILNLYKELCKITGAEVNKRHEVRLQVAPGHPEGPVRCLEKFLNDNIDAYGNPPFPDMHDVMQCVTVANHKYDMRWTQAQVVWEARALFTQFGRKMQKRRQKREWKDLLSLVKQEIHDPANDDPALQARLEANTRLARRNEHDLLERFVNLEHGLTSQSGPELRLSQSGDSGEDTDAETPGPGDGISTDNPLQACGTTVQPDNNMLSGINLPDCDENAVGTINFGSTMTVCEGKIVIQPTIKYGTPKTTDDVTFYTSEFKSFISNRNDPPPIYVIRDNRYINMKINCAQAKEVRPNIVNIDQENSDASRIGKEILGIVQSDICRPESNSLTKDSTIKTPCVALPTFNPTVRLTNLGPKNKYSPAKCLANTTKINEINVQSEIPTGDGFEIYTHTTKHKNTQANRNTDRGLSIETADKEISVIKNEVEEGIVSAAEDSTIANNLFENDSRKEMVTNAVSTKDTSTDLDTKDNIVDGIVKRERLDIPSMLAELGEGYTATIFDIEDPFLVIEISDSSESEDEGV